jgi:hypothetical protein
VSGTAAWGAGRPRAARRRAVVLLLLARERERRAAGDEAARQPALRPAGADGVAAPSPD